MRFTQYLLSGICVIFGLTSYLMFLAHRDTQMWNYFDSTTIQQER